MEKQLVIRLHKNFEDAAYQENGVEYWMARDIQELLGYDEWRNFTNVIDKAEIACKNARQDVSDHFVDVNKMVRDVLTSVFTGNLCFVDDIRKVAPLIIAE
jgi:DNA-damage-inducible protein D